MKAEKAVLLLSGGLDSTTALYHLRAIQTEVFPLLIHYGQRHSKELAAARRICTRLNLKPMLVDLRAIQPLISTSSQTNEAIEVPEGHYTEESMKLTVVPNRNMVMLSLAISWAVSLKADRVVYAAHAGDHTIYPDCRPEFIQTMNQAAQLCDWHSVELFSPFENWTKSDIVRRGLELRVPYEETWSCYKGLALHCGKCGTCVERKEAFALLNVVDPTVYADEIEEEGTANHHVMAT